MSDSSFKTFLPRAQALEGIIAYYYIHWSDSVEYSTSIQYYPHFRNAITVYQGSYVDLDETASTVKPSEPTDQTLIYSKNYYNGQFVNIKGPFYKLGIAFEPLGICHFIKDSIADFAPLKGNIRNGRFPSLLTLAKEILKNPKQDPTAKLDKYLKENLIVRRLDLSANAVDILMRESGDMSVNDLADELATTRKTLLRAFQRDLGCSVKTYQRLIKFRLALNKYIECHGKVSFTELALNHRYYDQPAFINHFREITGRSPKNFFKRLEQFGSADTYWVRN